MIKLRFALLLAAVPLAVGCPGGAVATSGGGTTSAGSASAGTTSGGAGCNLSCGTHGTCALDGGQPICACATGYQSCLDPGGTTCVDLSTDDQNCGDCRNVCQSNEVCQGGRCTCPLMLCPAPDNQQLCTDFRTDPSNCGSCNEVCKLGDECIDGTCQCTSTSPNCLSDAGLMCCQGECIDTLEDPFNCGACDNLCISGSCIPGDAGAGVCNCPQPYVWCGTSCVDVEGRGNGIVFCESDGETGCEYLEQYSTLDCRSSGCGCDVSQFLACCPGEPACVSTLEDALNCGGCGNVCDSGACLRTDGGGVCE